MKIKCTPSRLTLAMLVYSMLVACESPAPDTAAQRDSNITAAPVFVEIAAQVGLNFTHKNGGAGHFYFPEINGAGGALFDYDGDGDLDVYLVQSENVPGAEESIVLPTGNRLFRNLLVPTGELGFEDVTEIAGVGDPGYGIGVATGDYDNDADVDLYVINVGKNILYRNDGGVFTNVTESSGTQTAAWSAGGSFADYDSDGDLDLFVVNYVDWRTEIDIACNNNAGQRDYCSPGNYTPVSDRLFRNNGDGTFTDSSTDAGISTAAGPGLGVVAADFNGDGHTDFYVANDQAANHLWINTGDGTFTENGLRAGVAYNGRGAVEASMGVTAGDFDSDGDEDLFMTHLSSESNTLYVNDGTGNFVDGTEPANLGAASMRFTGFGSAWFDYDNDGLLDLFVANGSVMSLAERRAVSEFPYEQTNQLFRNTGDGRFLEISLHSGSAMQVSEVSRGAAFGDIDNDGDIDVLVTNNNGPVRLLRNDSGDKRHWLQLELTGTDSPRDAHGARVAIAGKNGGLKWRRAHSDGSYASASDVRVLFGLGDTTPALATIEVRWPSGHVEAFGNLEIDRLHRLLEGAGKPISEALLTE